MQELKQLIGIKVLNSGFLESLFLVSISANARFAPLRTPMHTGGLRISITLLQSDSRRIKRARLHTVEGCNIKGQLTRPLCCLCAPRTYARYASHTPHWWCIAHSTLRQRSGCNKAN